MALTTDDQASDQRTEPAGIVWLSAVARERVIFLAFGVALVIAGGLVAAGNQDAPFAHGSWLAAYLVLVGGIAQMALGAGCLALPAPDVSRRLRNLQLGLWNVGTLAVAGGELGASFGVVLGGSVVTAAALVCFGIGGGPVREGRRGRVLAYRVLIAVLVISVLTGGVLSHNGS